MQRIESKKGFAIRLEDDGTYTLEKGAAVSAVLGKSASDAVKSLRSSIVGLDGKTTEDHNFSSLSALASFVRGAQTNGKAYLAGELSAITPTSTSSAMPTNAASAEKASPAPAPKAAPKAKEKAKAEDPKKAEDKAEAVSALTKEQMAHADKVAKQIMTFCKDFEFKPDPRLINSLRYCSTAQEAGEMVANSMELIGMPEEVLNMAMPKFSSREWAGIFSDLKTCPTSHGKINNRLEIYYGPAGTGKTTLAEKTYKGCKKIVASATQDPSELFTRNVVNEHGGVDLVLTELGEAMTNGEPIIVDEANLYNIAVLTRLQGVTDNGTRFFDNGREIVIKDGFKVIITMNLETNYGKTPLPTPLVSRAGLILKMSDPFLGWVF